MADHVDMFIKLDGIEGEAKDDTHGKEIDVLSWSWGATQPGTFGSGGGGGAGKVHVQDMSFTHHYDKSSPELFNRITTGTHIPKAVLTVRKAGKDPLEYIVITLTDIIVSSLSTGGSGSEARLTEHVSLNFSKVEVKYQEQDEKGGKKGGPVTAGYDIAKNKKV